MCIHGCNFKLTLWGNVKELSKLIISQQLLFLRLIKCFGKDLAEGSRGRFRH